MSKLYQHNRHQISIEAAGFKVTGVRVNGNKAYALMAYTAARTALHIASTRRRQVEEFGVWKIDGVIDRSMT